jgi:hypothetical protein
MITGRRIGRALSAKLTGLFGRMNRTSDNYDIIVTDR